MFKVPELYRVFTGPLASNPSFGNNGLFIIPNKLTGKDLRVIASDGEGWEHVSVSLPNRCPNWEEMSFIKGLFWGEEDTVVQYHPKKSCYVNCHPFCLHLWKKVGSEFELPDLILVGPQ